MWCPWQRRCRGDSKDFRLVENLIDEGRIQADVVELPPGIEIDDIRLSWGTVDDGNGTIRATLDMAWNGAERPRIVMPRADDPIGWGIERAQFADGSLGLGDLVALAPPMPDLGDGTQLGNRQDNSLVARDGGEHLFGLGGNDVLIGGAGRDTLDGGAGNDRLTGGRGDDVYVFGRGDGRDLILDHDATAGNVDTVLFAAPAPDYDPEFFQFKFAMGPQTIGSGAQDVARMKNRRWRQGSRKAIRWAANDAEFEFKARG